MTNFILKRVALMILSLFIVILITFSLMHAVPGGPFTREKRLPPEVEAALNEKYHLNDPLPKQFFEYVKGLFTFDLGPSMKYQGKTVNDFIANGFPYSAKVGGVTILFVLITAIPLGIWAALNNNKWQDGLVLILATVGVTIPSFVVATLLMYLFSYQFDILPAFWDNSWKAYILPIIALGGYSVAFISRLMRSSLLEVMGQDYIRTARSKGLTERQVITRHAPQCSNTCNNCTWPDHCRPSDRVFCHREDFRRTGYGCSLRRQCRTTRLHRDYGYYFFLRDISHCNGIYRRYFLYAN